MRTNKEIILFRLAELMLEKEQNKLLLDDLYEIETNADYRDFLKELMKNLNNLGENLLENLYNIKDRSSKQCRERYVLVFYLFNIYLEFFPLL